MDNAELGRQLNEIARRTKKHAGFFTGGSKEAEECFVAQCVFERLVLCPTC